MGVGHQVGGPGSLLRPLCIPHEPGKVSDEVDDSVTLLSPCPKSKSKDGKGNLISVLSLKYVLWAR